MGFPKLRKLVTVSYSNETEVKGVRNLQVGLPQRFKKNDIKIVNEWKPSKLLKREPREIYHDSYI